MCMFSRDVEHVSATKIFAGEQADGRQALIYAMTVTVDEPLAMVLPLPVPANGPDDAIEFVNLEGYGELFTDLKKGFPDPSADSQPLGRSIGWLSKPALVVHEVGAFVASFVPNARDFTRLDPRFRLPPRVLEAMPHYADWGFAVFQLDRSKSKPIHPMAMRFPRRDPSSIYFPLTHVHDGEAPARAEFDHTLYGQLPPLITALTDWVPSYGPLGSYVDVARTHGLGLFDLTVGGHVKALLGDGPNRDLWLRPPANVSLEDLAGEGPSFRYKLTASYHFATASHPTYPGWLDTSANKLPQLCRGIRDGLAELTTRNARAWQLGVFESGLRPHFMNGNQLWSGTDYMTGRRVLQAEGSGVIAFRPFSASVEPQDLWLAFATLPEPDDAQTINRALCDLLERAARGA